MASQKNIKDDLLMQLELQDKTDSHYLDLVDDYITFYKIKKDLQKDVKTNGIRYKTTTGNGYEVKKPNESIPNLIKINAQMLKILTDLNLKEPVMGDDDEDYM